LENFLQQKCKILEEQEDGHMKLLELILLVVVCLVVYLVVVSPVVIPAHFLRARYPATGVATLMEAILPEAGFFFFIILLFLTFMFVCHSLMAQELS
jgi:heme/copper-type cytochrome/quinol oxidase subunit 2